AATATPIKSPTERDLDSAILPSRRVPDAAVTARAGHVPDLANEVAVTVETRGLQRRSVARLDVDRLLEILERERSAVVVAVQPLREVLPEEVVWHMAIVAGRHRVMRALLPALVLRVHDVTVRAGGRVVAQIGERLRVADGE